MAFRDADHLYVTVQTAVKGEISPLGINLLAVSVVAADGQNVFPFFQHVRSIRSESAEAAHMPG